MRKNLVQWLFALSASALLAGAFAGSARAREMVPFAGNYYPGTVIIKTKQRQLFLVLGDGYAIRYPVGVGKAGQQWAVFEVFGDGVIDHSGAEGHIGRGEPFGHGDDVGDDIPMVDGEPFTGTTKATHDFVTNQDDAVFVAELA